MIGKFDNIKIQGMASAVPGLVMENQSFENILGARRVKKQIGLTGVNKRHVSSLKQRTSDLCYAATIKLLKHLKWKTEDIKVLIFITQGPNYALPSTAFFLQKRLGLGKDCIAFDINLGCSSFNVGVQVVSALMQNCNVSDKALLLIGDTAGYLMKPGNKIDEDALAHNMLFGAAGACIAMEKVEASPLLFMNKSDGNGFKAIIGYNGGPAKMDGAAVFQFAINDVSEDVLRFRKQCNIKEEDIDYYVFHQAQKLILDNIAEICNIPEGKELRSLEEYGNTSGTSVPVSVCYNLDKFKEKENVRLLLCGFGVGLSWGMIYADVPTANILPIFETDEHYDEDKEPQGLLSQKKILVLDADTDMGQLLSRVLDDYAGQVYMCGKDEAKLQAVNEDLFFKNKIFTDITEIVSLCKEEEITFSGVMIAGEASYEELLKTLADEKILAEGTSVVKLSGLEKYHKGESLQEYYDNKKKLELCMDNEAEALLNIHGHVNAVTYDESRLNIVQPVGYAQDWMEKYIADFCPEAMLRPLRIADVSAYLLSEKARFVSKSIILADGE